MGNGRGIVPPEHERYAFVMHNTLMGSLVAALAARRLTTLVVEDRITETLRNAWWKRFPADETTLGYLPTCRSCSSIWAAAAVVALGCAANVPRGGNRVLGRSRRGSVAIVGRILSQSSGVCLAVLALSEIVQWADQRYDIGERSHTLGAEVSMSGGQRPFLPLGTVQDAGTIRDWMGPPEHFDPA